MRRTSSFLIAAALILSSAFAFAQAADGGVSVDAAARADAGEPDADLAACGPIDGNTAQGGGIDCSAGGIPLTSGYALGLYGLIPLALVLRSRRRK